MKEKRKQIEKRAVEPESRRVSYNLAASKSKPIDINLMTGKPNPNNPSNNTNSKGG